jgi:hypothetical protein
MAHYKRKMSMSGYGKKIQAVLIKVSAQEAHSILKQHTGEDTDNIEADKDILLAGSQSAWMMSSELFKWWRDFLRCKPVSSPCIFPGIRWELPSCHGPQMCFQKLIQPG